MNILDLLFPVKCPVCGRILEESERSTAICDACLRRLPLVTEPCCRHCGKPVLRLETEYCKDCSSKTTSFLDEGTALWIYTEKMKRAMADFKYGGCESDAKVYARELFSHRKEHFQRWRPDCLVPVPLHRRKRWFRGYNQAEAIAEHMGLLMGIPVRPNALVRIRYTKPQKELDDRQRRKNLMSAITGGEEPLIRGSRVLLIATLEACGRALRDMGADKVYFACLCIGQDY